MHQPFVPLLLLLLGPLWYLAFRLDLLRRRTARWALGAAAAGVIAYSVAAGGVDFVYLKRMKLGLAAATAAVVLLRGAGLLGLDGARRYRSVLAVLALAAWLVDLNFLGFHGSEGTPRTFVHLHDVAHYYLGSKYFAELGYTDLYVGMLRAEGERFNGRFKSSEARDLRTNAIVPVRELLAVGGGVKDRFTPTRWAAFQDDVTFFRRELGPQYAAIFQDHGFNPTPFWVAVGGTLANFVPAGSAVGIRLLALLDPALEAGMFAAIVWAFGVETMLLAMIYYCVLFGTSFGWTGGAYLRYMWLFGVVAGVCCLERRRHAIAGGLFAFATALRVFPIAFIAAIAAKALGAFVVSGRVGRPHARFLLACAVTGLVLLLSTAWLADGLDRWQDFRQNMQRHLETDAYNTIGLTQIVALEFPLSPGEAPGSRSAWIDRLYLVQLLLALPLAAVFVYTRARRADDVGAAALGIVLLFAGLNLAAYYYVCLLLLVLAERRRLPIIALLFTVEAATYTLMLFEDREPVLYLYRNILVGFLLLAVYLPVGSRQ